jgi:hypothetical protein
VHSVMDNRKRSLELELDWTDSGYA